jgi:hypothetical protein
MKGEHEMKKQLGFLILSVICCINLQADLNSEVQIAITREPTNGLTEEHFENPDVITAIEETVVEGILERSKQVYYNQGGTEKFDATFDSESWCLTIDGKNFVIVKISIKDLIQSTIIMGIQNDVFIKISGIRKGSDPVPHSYGPCAVKMEEIFGIKFPKLNPNK